MDAPSPSVCINVQRADRLPCAGPSQSRELCEKTGCCYDQSDPRTPCYYGDKITASCTMDGQLSVAVSRDATLPPLILSTVRLLRGQGAGCTPVAQNDVFLLFMFPLSTCGTTVAENGAFMVYENDLVAEKDIRSWRGASISRDSTFRLHIRCSVSASDHLPISAEVFTLPPPSPASSQGPVSLEMRIATDSSYGQYYGDGDYPIVKVLRDPLFVEVRILNRNDPALTLVLNQCWATTSSNPLLELQWPILVDRCPFDGDNYVTQLVSIEGSARLDFPSHYQRFIVNTFVFVDSMSQQSLGGLVYFHCSASLCLPSSFDSCLAACRSPRRKRASPNGDLEVKSVLVTSKGPVDFHTDNTDMSIKDVDHFTHTMDWTRVVVAVLPSAGTPPTSAGTPTDVHGNAPDVNGNAPDISGASHLRHGAAADVNGHSWQGKAPAAGTD
ncbi:zona pellucida sperm-binding protein 4-like [Spea bombifrons]|uniref:zona pellucida sperm-binding protein 4-like n=1 Tax=Spea bombifrons TaxID=233779 RepID=UPI00234A426E|nr:zona pellucida sperm-binding protein 4-like [Spea bombifrons]